MFRQQRRFKQELSVEVARDLLESEKRAVLAMNGDDGYPYAIPVDYYYDRESDKIYIHGAPAGHKYDSIKKDDKVCLNVYGDEEFRDGDWAPYLKSVVVFGRCRIIDDIDEIVAKAKPVGMKYYPTEESVDEILKDTAARLKIYEITIEHISGKQVHEC